MPKTLAFTLVPLFIALFAGCSGSAPPDAKSGPQECPAGFFWNGKECEKQRTILLDQGKEQPPPTPPPASSSSQ